MAPGDTPPGEASTSGISHPEPKLPSERTNKVVLGAILGATVLVALLLLGYAAGLAR